MKISWQGPASDEEYFRVAFLGVKITERGNYSESLKETFVIILARGTIMKIVIPRAGKPPLEFDGVVIATVESNETPFREYAVTLTFYKSDLGEYYGECLVRSQTGSQRTRHLCTGPHDSPYQVLPELSLFVFFVHQSTPGPDYSFEAQFQEAASKLPSELILHYHYAPATDSSEVLVPVGTARKSRHSAEQNWSDIVKEELHKLPVGKIVFNPPDRMKVGVRERIETRISKDLSINLISSLKGWGIPLKEDLKISEFMKVRLTGDNFDIIALNEEQQIIGPTEFTEWAWNVTPNRSGRQVLHLHVTLRIRLPFGEEKKDHPVIDRKIVVQVNPIYSTRIFASQNWRWILVTLLIPPIAYLLRTYYFGK